MEIPKNKPYRSKKYRDFIKMQPCIVCWNPGPSDPHHEDQTFHNKGMGIKAPDTRFFTIWFTLYLDSKLSRSSDVCGTIVPSGFI